MFKESLKEGSEEFFAALVYSVGDPAGKGMADFIRKIVKYRETQVVGSEVSFLIEELNALLIGFKEDVIYFDFLDDVLPNASFYVILSRHKASSGIKSLTVHHTGNPTASADMGGRPKELSIANPIFSYLTLRNLRELAVDKLNDFEVVYEVTHHGPTNLRKPLTFVEIGSSEAEWAYEKGIDVYSPSEKFRYRVMGDGYEVHRMKYTKYLLSEAINRGVEFWGESQGVEPLVKDGYVVGVSVWVKGRGKLEVGSKILVDASGMARAIVRKLNVKWPVREDIDPKDMNIAYREVRKLKKEIEEPEILRIYVSKKIAPGGYWWFFPYSKEGDVVNVGLGVQGGMNYPNPKDLLHEHVISREVFSGSEVIEAGGAAVPTRRPLKTLVWNGIAVTGDAAYAVNPVHGGGKGSAMLASWCISKSVRHALEVGDTSAKSLWEANICFNKRYGAKQAALDIFRLFLQRLSDEDLEYGMSKKIIKEEDLNTVSLKGDLELSVVEKAMRLLAGLSRPSLLFKLRRVAHYMNDAKQLYMNYPEGPEGLTRWYEEVEKLYSRFRGEV